MKSPPEILGRWLIENANHMNVAMFFTPGIWHNIEPEHILALRACMPQRILADGMTAQGFGIGAANENRNLDRLSEILFLEDPELIEKLPDRYNYIRSDLIDLIRIAYRNGLRPHNEHILRMR